VTFDSLKQYFQKLIDAYHLNYIFTDIELDFKTFQVAQTSGQQSHLQSSRSDLYFAPSAPSSRL
jgi:hypothetical protein